MKNLKKIICIVLSIFFAGTAMLFETKSVHAKQTNRVCENSMLCEGLSENNSSCGSAIKVVSALGIIDAETEDFDANEFLSRAKAAEIATKFLKLESDEMPYQALFFDVTETQWGREYIEVCVGEGIVNGMGDGTFRPNENITYHQMIKMLVCATGWECVALDEFGGWNNGGYISAAKQAGLIQTMPENVDRPITYGEVAEMICVALEVNVRDTTGSQEITDYTIRDLYWDLIKVKGVIEVKNEKSLIVLVTDNYESSNSIYQVGERYALDILDEDINLTVGDIITIYANEDDEIVVAIDAQLGMEPFGDVHLKPFGDVRLSNNP